MNADSDFFKFISQLSNLEKTRNFNVFTGYSLEPFAKVLNQFDLNKRNQSTLCRISVVGTNAKGSITHFLGEYFRLFGFKTGLYTSPHLISPLERIKIGTNAQAFRDIQTKELDQLLSEWKSLGAEEALKSFSFFELFTCAAFFFFEKESAEIQIYEAGLGGRLDATKLCDPDVVVLGVIGLDHREILGNTKEKILHEKLEICTHNTKVLFAINQKEPELNEKIASWCSQNKIPCKILPQVPPEGTYLSRNKHFSYGVFQNILNLEWFLNLNKKASSFLDKGTNSETFSFDFFEKYISNPFGRLTVLRNSPLLVFDPAHNPDAFNETLQSLSILYPARKFRVYAGLLKDKDGDGILKILRNALNKSDILDFRFLKESGFAFPESCRSEETIDDIEFKSMLRNLDDTQKSTLILGSFRLFPIVSDSICH
ncbi:bifunctional folylpolyglutamate synthase/dihydrofolate synthase [Leptospira mayottensis]|uniref:Bifunctional protein FolC n=2 Tax=Leptospira mayottensis TaxID=1137606 RepID=A0AA87MR31_9LEPT|nr:bifunctional folylpolyglutamate synthase/dihydrofolate synthase [Leptospira mayottensis]AXR62161.1 bifunctional folylpolyglutamate synthase/dihydrofolate synthase [Leptospira mayottensis]AXR63038.1 bifunctional folylpolyglutamate synthase/dihydrofolate synthase [Leptospira mayottensis]AZQ01386.1 bifunctional folylpolyglutamate synthase/dihydrofolate synthase [Leptospira mayottensis 200901116]EKS00748.1 bifunctional protein FolC [Leptospira mayottensis 200901122]TGN08663.1 bifunctional folyl